MPENDFISLAARTIIESERKRFALIKKIRPIISKKIGPFDKMIEGVQEIELNGRISGVDSGFVGKNFLSLDLVLIRGKAAIFDYKDGKLEKAHYLPDYFSFPEAVLSHQSLQKEDISTNMSLQRLKKEIDLAEQSIKEFNPEYCFLDGSIVPQHADKPRQDSQMQSFYKQTVKHFESLFETAIENNCTVIGCVEDSRGTRFKDLVESLVGEKGFSDCFDTVLLDQLLKVGERTFAFPYAKKVSEHPVLKDFSKKYSEKIHAFYLKPCILDRPLRAEFLLPKNHSKKDIDRIASVIFAQSSNHREYAYPAVLIEADLRARLRGDEIKIICDKIFDRLGSSTKIELRRNKRPF